MPRNGSGSYNLPNGPFVPSTVISSTTMNQNLSDLGTALTQSIANDGQTTPVANLPMATFRHTNVGNAVNRTDYAAAGQVQDSSLQWLTSIAGTDTITASITPSPAAYAAGQTFRFVAAGANTTTSVTLNINGLGAKNVTKRGTNSLDVGDIRSGQIVELAYDGTQFQLLPLNSVLGTPTNNNANAGIVGEYITSTSGDVSLSTTVNGNVTTISLSAGDWSVGANAMFSVSGVTSQSVLGISSTSAAFSTTPDFTLNSYATSTGSGTGCSAPTMRFSLAATTTIYLVANAIFTGTGSVKGRLWARRER